VFLHKEELTNLWLKHVAVITVKLFTPTRIQDWSIGNVHVTCTKSLSITMFSIFLPLYIVKFGLGKWDLFNVEGFLLPNS
jgi:hypothetical protein